MRRVLFAALAAIAIGALTAGTGTEYSGITTLTLQNGLDSYTGCTDTYIAEYDSTKNFGACDTLKLSYATWTGYQVGTKKSLIKFDISSLPDSAIITQAYLYLYQYSNNSGALQDTMFLRRAMKAWDEGAGVCAGSTGQNAATWKDYDGGSAWNTLGANASSGAKRQWYSQDSTLASGFFGTDTTNVPAPSEDSAVDFECETILKAGIGASNRYGWVAVNVGRQVRLWHIGANRNDGFILSMHNSGVDKEFLFYSSEYAGYTYRPKLVIKYFDPTTVASGSSRRTIGHRTKGGVN